MPVTSKGVRLAILILNYNGARHLPELFESMAFLRDSPDADVWLFDNASSDESLQATQAAFPWVRLHRNSDNFGFGGGYNQGIEALRKAGHSYTHYVFLNNDVSVSPAWYEGIRRALLEAPPDVAEWGVRSLFRKAFVYEFHLRGRASDSRALTVMPLKGSAPFFINKVKAAGDVGLRLEMRVDARRLPAAGTTIRYFLVNETKRSMTLRTCGNLALIHDPTHKGSTPCYRMTRGGTGAPTHGGQSDSPPLPATGTLTLPRGGRVLVERTVVAADTEMLVQNSGSGLNSRFEGYDLHAFEPFGTPQDDTSLRAICGVCKVVRADVFHALGGFDERFFMYYEDTEFSLRLRAAGYEMRLLSDVILLHEHSGTSVEGSPFFTRQVVWSLFLFHYLHAGFLRRAITLVRFLLIASRERADITESKLTKFHQIALRRFRETEGGVMRYLLGPRRASHQSVGLINERESHGQP